MKRNAPQENTGRVVAVALAFFGALVAIAYAEGVFAKLSNETLAALGIFAVVYSIATYAMDRSLRRWVNGLRLAGGRSRARKAPAKSPGGTPAAT